jgi:hypothetical protein
MRRGPLTLFSGLVLMIAFAGVAAFAQHEVVFQAPFEFRAGNQVLPAGNYVIRVPYTNVQDVTLSSEATGKTIFLPFTTRLGPRDLTEGEAVFDRVGDVAYLSEIYIPGMDGFAFPGAPVEHSHTKVKLQKRK